MMKLSEGLFAPVLNMKWRWMGTAFELLRDEKVIWTSIKGAQRWDYITANMMAKILLDYINTPVVDLKIKKLVKSYFYESDVRDNYAELLLILLAADRRLGKNTLSVWLFTEPDQMIRNIIGSRL